jgi:hypothetical protein
MSPLGTSWAGPARRCVEKGRGWRRNFHLFLGSEKLLNLPYKKFTWVRLFWNFFRHDYNNLGRFTQLCQTFDLFVCLLIGFFFISMNYNPKKHTSHFIFFSLFIPKQTTWHNYHCSLVITYSTNLSDRAQSGLGLDIQSSNGPISLVPPNLLNVN